jgi:hypothetical protein
VGEVVNNRRNWPTRDSTLEVKIVNSERTSSVNQIVQESPRGIEWHSLFF